MSTRINLTITNSVSPAETIVCRKILCQNIENLNVGTQLKPGDSGHYTVSTNDRVYCLWQGLVSGTEYQLAMTCPKSSHNSAAGYGSAGLQTYSRTGTPVSFTFEVGTKDLADWDNGNSYEGNAPTFGDCS